MAAALTQRPGVFQNLIEGFARRIDEVSGNRFGNWLKDSTGLTPLPGFLSKSNFGVVKALQSTRKPPSLGDMLLETVNYAIDEARERLSSLVNGSFIPGGVHELFTYLKEHSYDLESRINKITGEITNFLVDMKSKTAIPAVQVDPSLSHASVLKLSLASRLRQQIGHDAPAAAFGSWSGMTWTRDSIQSKYGYTVERNQGYFGRVVGIVSDNETENAKMFAEFKSRGIDVIVPRTHEGTGKPVTGMPILSRANSMKAEEVHKGLDHVALSEKFGGGMIDHYVKMATQAKSPRAAVAVAQNMSRDDFNRMFLRVEKDIEPISPSAFGFDANVAESDIVIRTNAQGKHYAWDRGAKKEALSAVNCLPYGEYERFDAQNKLVGYTTVGDNGTVTHYDKAHREIPNELPRVRREEAAENTASYGFS